MEIIYGQDSLKTQAAPGLVLLFKPVRETRDMVERATNASRRERTAKDFVDLLENAGVLLWLCPESPEFLAGDELWRQVLPESLRDLNLERLITTGGRDSRNYVLLLVQNAESHAETALWTELATRIIHKFF